MRLRAGGRRVEAAAAAWLLASCAIALSFCCCGVRGGDALASTEQLDAELVALLDAYATLPDHDTEQRHAFLQTIGLTLHRLARHSEALDVLDAALALQPRNTDSLFTKAVALANMGHIEEAGAVYNQLLAIDMYHDRARLNIAALHHSYGSLPDAIAQYSIVIDSPLPVPDPIMVMALTNKAQALVDTGDITAAVDHMLRAAVVKGSADFRLTVVEFILRAHRVVGDWSNHHDLVDELLLGVPQLLQRGVRCPLLPFDTMILPVPLAMRYAVAMAYTVHNVGPGVATLPPLHPHGPRRLSLPPLLPDNVWPPVATLAAAGASWQEAVAVAVVSSAADGSQAPCRAPTWDFMALPADKRHGAVTASGARRRCVSHVAQGHASRLRLHVGYFTCDFTNHPTAHMAEGLFQHHDRHRVAVSALSFGRDDGSDYRARTMSAADSFLNIVTLSHAQSAAVIQTAGSRAQVVARRPAPIQVNFLVYPGTTGSPYIDYLVADPIVAPPEHAAHYSERLVLMPNSYQVNYYTTQSTHRADSHSRRRVTGSAAVAPAATVFVGAGMKDTDPDTISAGAGSTLAELRKRDPDDRQALGLPSVGVGFVFANFNKNEKLEPRTFAVWMSILRRVPGSVLWLLTPQQSGAKHEQMQRLQWEAAAHGVHPRRIVFAERCEKDIHLARHRHVDLFIDTLVYGAHSTATDALRGAAPVLTCLGEAFPSRVAASLLVNTHVPWLVTHDVREFEDVAVRLAHNPALLEQLRTRLAASVLGDVQGVHEPPARRASTFRHLDGRPRASDPPQCGSGRQPRRLPLFDTPQFVSDLERSMQAMWDVYVAHVDTAPAAGDTPVTDADFVNGRRHLVVGRWQTASFCECKGGSG